MTRPPAPATYSPAIYRPAPGRPTSPARQKPEPKPVEFLAVKEVAAYLRVSPMTIYRLIHALELPAIRVGRSFRVPKRGVDQYLREQFAAMEEA